MYADMILITVNHCDWSIHRYGLTVYETASHSYTEKKKTEENDNMAKNV